MKAPHTRPIITLTTDFGLADHYVGVMKGVLLSRCPDAQLVDISHEIAPFSIYSGAYSIDQTASHFAPGTVHLIVVDPGVGTPRKPLCVEALQQVFIAPDNGVLSLIAARDPNRRARELANRSLWLESPSSTFHGRDIFAPVAGVIASGAAKPQEVGPILEHIHVLKGLESHQLETGVWQGRVLSIDRFGNVITNLRSRNFGCIATASFAIEAHGLPVNVFCNTFGEASAGVCFAYFGSAGYIELGVNQQSAARLLGIAPGDALKLEF